MGDKGFGTAYETMIFKSILESLILRYGIQKVLEYPTSNLLNNFERKWQPLESRYPEPKYDLVWNFCEFEQAQNSEHFIEEVSSKTDKYVMITIQNNKNIGVALHWIYHKTLRKKYDHGIIDKMSSRKLRQAIAEKGLVICEDGYHDVPWFIVDVYECGSYLKKLVPSSTISTKEIRPSRFERLPNVLKSLLAHHYHVIAMKPASAADT